MGEWRRVPTRRPRGRLSVAEHLLARGSSIGVGLSSELTQQGTAKNTYPKPRTASANSDNRCIWCQVTAIKDRSSSQVVASIGSCALAGSPMATNQDFKNLIPSAEVDTSYLVIIWVKWKLAPS